MTSIPSAILAALLALGAAFSARSADFADPPAATMRDIVIWGLDAGVPETAWPQIDVGYDAYVRRLGELAAANGTPSSLRDRLLQEGAGLPECEREMVRRTDLLLAEEERLAAALREALGQASEAAGQPAALDQAGVDRALVMWTARRMVDLAGAVRSPPIYQGVQCDLPDVDGLRDRLALSDDAWRAANEALAAHLPVLAEKARAFVRARARVLAQPLWGEPAGPHEVREAAGPSIMAARQSRLALLRAHQIARRSVIEALPPEQREEAARMLLASLAPGAKYTRVGTIAETIVPYLHELDDRTQRKLSHKIRQLRTELAAAERRSATALEDAIERGDFDQVVQAADGFERSLDEIAEREGAGISTLIGPRCVEDLVSLEMGGPPDSARDVLARLMPPSRVEDFLGELAAKDAALAAQFAPAKAAPRAGASLADALPPDPELMVALRVAIASLDDESRGRSPLEPAPGVVELEQAWNTCSAQWRELVVPVQARVRASLWGDPAAVNHAIVFLSLRMEEDGTLSVDKPLDYEKAKRAMTELDRIIDEVDGAFMEAIDRLIGARAPDVALGARLDRAFDVHVRRSVASSSRTPGPTARPVDCTELLDSIGLDRAEREGAMNVAAAELRDYARALGERSRQLHRAALLQRLLWEREWSPWPSGLLGAKDAADGVKRATAERREAQEAAESVWRAAFARVMAAWSHELEPERMHRLRAEALRQAYPSLALWMKPIERVLDEAEVIVPEGDPRRPLVDALVLVLGEQAWQRFESAAIAAESREPLPSGLVASPAGTGAPLAPFDGGAYARGLDDLAARAMRDLWIATGEARLLAPLDAR